MANFALNIFLIQTQITEQCCKIQMMRKQFKQLVTIVSNFGLHIQGKRLQLRTFDLIDFD
jgi:hypothetical protein